MAVNVAIYTSIYIHVRSYMRMFYMQELERRW